MVEQKITHISRKTWYKWSFYINIVLFFIAATSVYFLVVDTYYAGKTAVLGGGDLLSQAWLSIARDLAFLSISMALIFFQFFRNLLTIIRRSL